MKNHAVPKDRGFNILATSTMSIVTILTLTPFVLLFMSSVASEKSLAFYGYQFWPSEFSLDAYLYISRNAEAIFRSYGITLLITACGTILGVLLTALLAFPLSQKDFSHRGVILFAIFFTMLFNGGMVPNYIMWTRLFHIKNTLAALLFPRLLLNAFNVILMKNYFQHSIPDGILEAAEIDGAGVGRTFTRIVLPLGKPIFATIGMFYILSYWNDFTNGLYYVTDSRYFSLQVLLNNILSNIQFLVSNSKLTGISAGISSIPSVSIRMAIASLGIVPLLVLFPFFQRYFVQGITMGAVKG